MPEKREFTRKPQRHRSGIGNSADVLIRCRRIFVDLSIIQGTM